MYNQKEVDKYYKGATIYEAMGVWSLPKTKRNQIEKICSEGKYFAQLKKDGNWYEFSKSHEGKCYLFSRGVSKKTGLPVEAIEKVPHIQETMKVLPSDTVILGEIYYPNQTTNEVRAIMGCLPNKSIERQKEKGNIHFFIHDILMFDGEDLTSKGAYERYKILAEKAKEFNLLNEYIEIAPIVTKDIYDFLCNALAKGEEGGILKLKTGTYEEGKRPAWNMIKWKEHDTVDVFCIGFNDATKDYEGDNRETWDYWIIEKDIDFPNGDYQLYKKCDVGQRENLRGVEFRTIPVTKAYYYGWKMAIEIGAYAVDGSIKTIGTVSSGLSDELRKDLSINSEKYLNKVIEVDCMRKTEGTLRHPVFIKFRDDKNAKDCIFEEIFN